MALPTSRPKQYLVHHQGDTQGPFEVSFIEAMIMSGVYPPSVIVENTVTSKKSQFSRLQEAEGRILPPVSAARPTPSPQNTEAKSREKSSYQVIKFFYVFAAIVVCVLVVSIVSTLNSTSSSKTAKKSTSPSSSRSYSSTQPTAPTKPKPKPRKRTTEPYKRTTYSKPRAAVPPADTKVYRDANGNTYRVSDSDHFRLSSMKSSLSMKASTVDYKKIQLRSLTLEVDSARYSLDNTSQYQVDAFNRKVNQVNAMNNSVQSVVDDYNRDVNSFNRELERLGTLIR